METHLIGQELDQVTQENYKNEYISKLNRITLETTYDCNLHCKMCFLHGDNGVEDKGLISKNTNYMSLEEYNLLLDDIKCFQPHVPITITGGEAFMRSDCIDICKAVSNHGFPLTVATNGTLISDQDIEVLKQINAKVILSLDGTESINDFIRGKGTFEIVTSVAEKMKKSDINFHFNFTISCMNYKDIYNFAKYCSEHDYNISFEHLWFTDEFESNEHAKSIKTIFGCENDPKLNGFINEFNLLDTNQLKEQIKKVLLDKSLTNTIAFFPALKLCELDPYYNDLHGYVHSEKCYYHFSHLRINPYGEVVPCVGNSMGNVNKTYISDIINGPNYNAFRKKLKEIGLFPNCRRCCKL